MIQSISGSVKKTLMNADLTRYGLCCSVFDHSLKGYTPYPKWCVIFCVPIGMIISMLIGKIGNYNITNAIRCAWISIGNLFMFLGLLIMKNNYQMEKHKRIGI